MRKRLSRILLLASAILTVVACAYLGEPQTYNPEALREAVGCTQIVEDSLLDFPIKHMTLTKTVDWVKGTYMVEPREDAGRLGTFVRWTWAGRDYTSDLIDGFVRGVAVRWQHNPPIAQEILDCIGEPAYYQAYRDPTPTGPDTVFALWYPAYGLRFYGSVPAVLTGIDRRVPLQVVTYVEPGSLQETVDRVFIFEPGDDVAPNVITSIKPWPGSLDQIVIGDPPY